MKLYEHPVMAGLMGRWGALAPRERTLIVVAAVVVGLWLVWMAAVRPALGVLRAAPEERRAAQARLDQVQALASEATALREMGGTGAAAGAQARPRTMDMGIDDELRVQVQGFLGERTVIDAQGRHVTVTFEAMTGDQVRGALTLLRSRLNAKLIEAELMPAGQGLRGRLRFEWQAS